jgi:probable F420-dependent oxidoreductase
MSMPLALSIASHSGLPPAGVGAVARAAELAGFAAVFVAEGHGDALALCHPVAAATRHVRVGTAITNAALRPPVLAAKTAAQLDHASGGRFILGLGVANTVMNTRFGIAPFPPLTMIEEYTAVVRAVLGGSPDGYDGRVFRTGMVPLDSPPERAALPVYLAALGPRMLELSRDEADGAHPYFSPVEHTSFARQVLGPDKLLIPEQAVVLAQDSTAARSAARAYAQRYLQLPNYVTNLRRFGFGDPDTSGTGSDRLIDAIIPHGPAVIAERVRQHLAAGADHVLLQPLDPDGKFAFDDLGPLAEALTGL